jgi:TRIAD3 protein (E3 ubiquitin-protein ligase RNF216)
MLVSQEFPEIPMTFITRTLDQSGYRLFSAYRVLEEAHRTFDQRRPPYNKIKNLRKMCTAFKEEHLEQHIQDILRSPFPPEHEVEALRELQAARRIRMKADEKRLLERQSEIEEEENFRRAEAEGTMSECGCCFGDFPLNRMVHCDNEQVLHWFCRGCAKQNADTEIGNSKYQLHCMSMDGCKAGFSLEQR